jgi:hypothetical protein
MLEGHEVETVIGLGWAGVQNGELLRRATRRFDAFVTMDRNIEFQQVLARQSFGAVLIRARSNRMIHLQPLVPALLGALEGLKPGEIKRVGA